MVNLPELIWIPELWMNYYFTNLIFLDSKIEVPMINKQIIIFASTQVQKMAKFERKQQNYLYFSRRKILQKSTITC